MSDKDTPGNNKGIPPEENKYDFSNLTFEELFRVPVIEMSFRGEPLAGPDFFQLDFLALQRTPVFLPEDKGKEEMNAYGNTGDVDDESFDFLALSFEDLLKVPVKLNLWQEGDGVQEPDIDSLSLADLMKLPVRRAFVADLDPETLKDLLGDNAFSDLPSTDNGSGSSNSGNPLLYVGFGNSDKVTDTSPPIDNSGNNNGPGNTGGGFTTPPLNYLPSISMFVTAPADPLGVNESTLGMSTSANFADNFTFNSDFGGDGAGFLIGPTYALSIIAGPSGLVDVATGQNIILSMNNGVVEGRTQFGNALVFTVSVNASGIVTLDQDRPIRHPDGTNPNDPLTLSSNNLIKIGATTTITDSNGDSATSTATINIGQAINFDDDGPTILVSAVAPADPLIVDESNLGDNATANFADNFNVTSNFGGDGAGSLPPPVYTLSIIAGPSGLVDVATGQNVILSMNAGIVEGRTATGGALVFTLSVDSVGNVTLDQIRALQHPNNSNPDDAVALSAANLIKITATSTITDRDGDSQTSSASINIGTALSFKDDGPSILVSTVGTADLLSVDETTLGTPATANFADNFTITSNYGADNAGSLPAPVYSLSVIAGPSGLVDVATGQNVILSLNGGVVEGRTETGNALIFTLSVNNSSGVVTFTQIAALQHPNTTNPDDAVTLSAANLIKITATSTITDRDGDNQTSAASIDIGTALSFKDDGPSILVSTVGTADLLSVDETTLGTPATANFADNFTITSNYGADNAGSLPAPVYSLSVIAGPSGLVDVATGQNVILSMNGGVVEGRTETGNALVFTLSVNNSSGVVTFTQIAALQHPNTTNPDDAVTLSAANLIKITATSTITDRDGDNQTSAASIDIGTALSFKDDGPSILVSTVGTADLLSVDETTLGTPATANFADNFTITSNYGADNAGSLPAPVYSLSVIAGPSGLIDVATGQNVILSMNGGVVEGRTETGNALVFTLSVNNTGAVTLTQIAALQHPNTTNPDDVVTLNAANLIKITATSTITDRDGDNQTSAASIDIGTALSFKDDGPSILINTVGTADILAVDESNLNNNASADFSDNFTITPNYGADGEGGLAGTTYTLSTVDGSDSGLVDSGSNNPVLLKMEGEDVVGYYNDGVYDVTVFTLSVNNTSGVVTLNQVCALQHPDGSTANAVVTLSAADLIKLTATDTITDRDGDTATGSQTIDIATALQFHDDAPHANNDNGGYAIKGGDSSHATGNLLTNDTVGADSPLVISAITFFNSTTNMNQTVNIVPGGSATVTPSLGGTLVVNSNGTYSYTPPAPDNSIVPDAPSTVSFSYVAQDADGSLSNSANVDIKLYDKPIIYVAANEGYEEGDGSAAVTVILYGQIPEGISVNYTTQNNDATSPQDYTSLSGTITFNASDLSSPNPGSQQQIINVPITNDNVVEGTERFNFIVTDNNNAVTIEPSQPVEIVIIDDDYTLKATNDTVSVSELALDPNLPVTTPTQSGNVLTNDTTTAPANTLSVNKIQFVADDLLANHPTLYQNYINQGATITPNGNQYTVQFNVPSSNSVLSINMPDNSVLKIQSNGHYDFYQPQGGISQDAHYDWTYTITAPNALPVNSGDDKGVLSINVENQLVYANNDQLFSKGVLSHDLVLMLDVSSSMNTMVSGLSRLAIEKMAAINIINTYDALAGDLKVTIIPFGSNASNSDSRSGAFVHTTTSVADAIAYINTVAVQMKNASGQKLGTGTEYDDALYHARNYLDTAIAPNSSIKDYAHVVYFMTDGAPTAQHAAASLTPSWQSFVNDPDNTAYGGIAGSTVKQIDVIPVTIDVNSSNNINNALNPVGNTGQTSEIVNLDYNNGQIINLNALYNNLSSQPPITINLLTNDIDTFDNVAGDLKVTQLSYFNPTLNATVHYDLSDAHPQEVFTTAKGATVTINADGTFVYQAGPGFNAPNEISEVFNYKMANDSHIVSNEGQISATTYNNNYTLVNLPGTSGNDILNNNGTYNQGTVIMSGASGNNTFTIDMGMSGLKANLIVIQDFAEGGNNTLKFINVQDGNNDTVIQHSEIVAQITNVHSDSPYAGGNISFQLQNGTTVVMQNLGASDPLAAPPPSTAAALISFVDEHGNIVGSSSS